MKNFILTLFFTVACFFSFAQGVSLTFSGYDIYNNPCQLSRVIISNVSQGWQDTLSGEDMTLEIPNVTESAIVENPFQAEFGLSQNVPNPFSGTTEATLTVAKPGMVVLKVVDVKGQNVAAQSFSLQPGGYQVRLHIARPGVYLLTASQNGIASSIKMVSNGGGKNGIELMGSFSLKNGFRDGTDNESSYGDQMEYVGYADLGNGEEESNVTVSSLDSSQTIPLTFGTALEGVPSVATSPATELTRTSATLGGSVLDLGNDSVVTCGICYATSPAPEVSDNCVGIANDGIGLFSQHITGLAPNTTYYVRAFARNNVGVAYGEEISFNTLASTFAFGVDSVMFIPDGPMCEQPCLTSSSVCNLSPDSAVINSVTDVLSVRLNLEQSFAGEVNITLICPNGQSVLLQPDHFEGTNSIHFGMPYELDDEVASHCNPDSCVPGIGWNYCWSEDSTYAQINGYCFHPDNYGHYLNNSIDHSTLSQGFPGEQGFVQGVQYYMPFESFSNLIGCPVNGQWQVQVCDVWTSDNGFVFAWEVILNPAILSH